MRPRQSWRAKGRIGNDPEQYSASKEAEADETAKGADKAFRSVVKARKPK
jgi:hypothetical protein